MSSVGTEDTEVIFVRMAQDEPVLTSGLRQLSNVASWISDLADALFGRAQVFDCTGARVEQAGCPALHTAP